MLENQHKRSIERANQLQLAMGEETLRTWEDAHKKMVRAQPGSCTEIDERNWLKYVQDQLIQARFRVDNDDRERPGFAHVDRDVYAALAEDHLKMILRI